MIYNLISSLIKWALILGACGSLVDTTIAMRSRAMDASRVGLVSLTTLNHQLLGKSHGASSR